MDFSPLIDAYGLQGAVFGALTAAVVALWRRVSVLQDARVEDMRQHSQQTIEMIRVLDKAVSVMEAKR